MNICASCDNFGAYSENCEGIFASGDTIEQVKADTYEAIRLIKENLPEERWPEQIKGEFEIEWHYDAQSCFCCCLWHADVALRTGAHHGHPPEAALGV